MFSRLLTFVPLVLAVISATAASSRPRVVHNGVAKRMSGELAKRFSSTRWTFYDVGLGACGQTNVASDFIVALNAEQFGSGYPGPHCFKNIQMTYNGKSATATIMDSCPGCPYGALDLSRGLFTHFDSEDKGIIYGEWSFVDDNTAAPPAPATSTKAASVAPITTPKVQGAPTTQRTNAWAPPATSTTAWVAPTASHSTTAAVAVSPVAAASGVPAASSSSSASSSSNAPSHTAPTTSVPKAIASSSVASLASAFSATTANTTGTGAGAKNTTAQIEHNLNEINALITKLGKLIMSARLSGSNSTN
ncbi:RlpA-like double-psi beta-barrel-protein domain-containing protein-containing protein [Pholiota molesta]|nr:RlpA-like double-psi beta-barrel-protein domain-containing protein-containing protein [Pholiota molesta]